MYLTQEVQVMAQRVLTERGCPVQPNNNSDRLAGSTATDGSTWSSTSSNRFLSMHCMSSSTRHTKGGEPCETNTEALEADIASFSLTNLKSAYLQAAANLPSNGSACSSSSSSSSSSSNNSRGSSNSGYVHHNPVAGAGSTCNSGGVSVTVAAMRSNFLQAFKDNEQRLKEAAAEAAAAAAAAAAAETAAGGISVSSLRSSWLETQRQEAERAAAEAAVAASLASGKPRPPAVRASSPGTWGAAAASSEQQPHATPLNAPRRFSFAGPVSHAEAPAGTAAATAVTGQRVLDKTKEVAQMAERVLRTKRVLDAAEA